MVEWRVTRAQNFSFNWIAAKLTLCTVVCELNGDRDVHRVRFQVLQNLYNGRNTNNHRRRFVSFIIFYLNTRYEHNKRHNMRNVNCDKRQSTSFWIIVLFINFIFLFIKSASFAGECAVCTHDNISSQVTTRTFIDWCFVFVCLSFYFFQLPEKNIYLLDY